MSMNGLVVRVGAVGDAVLFLSGGWCSGPVFGALLHASRAAYPAAARVLTCASFCWQSSYQVTKLGGGLTSATVALPTREPQADENAPRCLEYVPAAKGSLATSTHTQKNAIGVKYESLNRLAIGFVCLFVPSGWVL